MTRESAGVHRERQTRNMRGNKAGGLEGTEMWERHLKETWDKVQGKCRERENSET